ncbi:unnamed protein product [Urochloa decumbens]|uniref:DUF1618 domain-containing protein n=1 Tax=Urochloa decumbens TaxID=240449 RepID=A0ABC9DZN6_9POAL
MSLERRHHVDDDDDGDEIEKRKAKKVRKTPADFLLLDRLGHQNQSDDDGDSTWTAPSVTSRGVRFQLSLRPEEPPAVSRLLFKAVIPSDILTSYSNLSNAAADAYFLIRPSSTQFDLVVVSSDDKAVLLQASCGGGRDYFVMDHHLDSHHSPPALSARLQEMPPCTRISIRLGLMRRAAADDSYVVAGLETGDKGWWHVSFLSTSANVWRRKPVRLAAPELRDWHHLDWDEVDLVACGGRFYWLDLRRGLLSCSCDSLLAAEDDDDEPLGLQFTLLPNVTMKQAREARICNYPLTRDQCVGVSGGHLRYVEVSAHRHRPSSSYSPVAPPALCDDCRGGSVTSWVLVDGRSAGAWAKEHTLKFADVWREDSYRSTGLPMEAPEFPLVHPLDPNILYFSIREGKDVSGREFCVHLGTKQVKSCSSSYKGLNVDVALEPVFAASLKTTRAVAASTTDGGFVPRL